MQKAPLLVLMIAAAGLAGCSKQSSAPSTSAAASGDATQHKLQELAGSGATDCGRLKSMAPDQMKTASDCAMQAAQNKRPFYVAYDLPGMTVGVTGNSEGKLYAVQSQQPENAPAQPGTAQAPSTTAELKSEPCPSELRIAQSGRVTCFAPGSFGMGSSGAPGHGGMSMPPAGGENPHGGMTMPPSGSSNPHAGKPQGMADSHGTTSKNPPKQ